MKIIWIKLLCFSFLNFVVTTVNGQSLFFNANGAIVHLSTESSDTPVTYAEKTNKDNVAEAIAYCKGRSSDEFFVINAGGILNANKDTVPDSRKILIHPSSTEIIVCPANQQGQYYIFYNQEQCSGLYYSVLDTEYNEGGGSMAALNIALDSINNYAEGLEIVKNPCGEQYWLIAYACNIGFRRFSITPEGIQPEIATFNYQLDTDGGRGELEYHQGKMAFALAFNNKVLLADFDPMEGDMKNIKEIKFPSTNGIYGLTFTENNEKIFVTDWNNRDIFGNIASPNLFSYSLKTEDITSWNIEVENVDDILLAGLGQAERNEKGDLYVPYAGSTKILKITDPERTEPKFNWLNTGVTLSFGLSDPFIEDSQDEVEIYTDRKTLLCAGEKTILYTDTPSSFYQWMKDSQLIPKQNANTLVVEAEGKYQVIIENSYGCRDTSDFIQIHYVDMPEVTLVQDIISCKGEPVILSASGEDNYRFLWSTGDTTKNIQVYEAGDYWLKIYYNNCEASNTIHVDFEEPVALEIPNVITPNNDGLNDYFYIFPNGSSKVELSVFNRWGTLVFYSSDYQNDWNGSNLSGGQYYYLLRKLGSCSEEIKGWLSILR